MVFVYKFIWHVIESTVMFFFAMTMSVAYFASHAVHVWGMLLSERYMHQLGI